MGHTGSTPVIGTNDMNNYSLVRTLRRDDPRRKLYRQQRKERGFDNSELWSLNSTILTFTLPRLKEFRDYTQSYPLSDEINSHSDWQRTIDKMIHGIELYLEDSWDKEAVEGIELFFKYFRHLWS